MMRGFWQGLEVRQQRVLMLAAVVLVGVLGYVMVWEPLVEAREAERQRVSEQRALLSWLDALAPVAEQLRQGRQRSEDLGGRSLLGLADETARAARLAGALTRIEPTGDDRVRVWLDGADFVAAMGWLESFSRDYPVEVRQLQVDRAGSPGQVNLRVTLVGDA